MRIALDPGISTGYAARHDNGAWATATLSPGAATDLRDTLQWLLLDRENVEEVVIETFASRGLISAYGIETIELIGAVRGICSIRNIAVVRQTPTQRLMLEPTATELLRERRRTLGARYTNHEISALAHLLRREHTLSLIAAK